MSAAGIVGLGLWVPDEIRTNDAWPESFERAFRQQREARNARDFTHIEPPNPSRRFDDLFARHALPHDGDPFKGATVRRVAPDDLPSAEADARAVVRALEDARVAPAEVDLILSAALVPDRIAPSNGPAIQHLSGCVNAAGLGVEGFCSSAVAHLDLASGLVACGRARFVVCVQSHLIARINDLSLPFSPIFGDASAAFVVGPVPEGRGVTAVVRGGDGSLARAVTHAYRKTPGATWWKDAAGPICPGTEDPEAAKLIARSALAYPIDTIRALSARADVPLDAVAAFATIQPLVWYQAAIADGLGVPAERFPSTFGAYAHLGSAALVANLLEARRRGMLREGAPVVLYAHGAGITRFAALLRW